MMFLNRKKDLLADARASVEARQNAFRTAFEALPRAAKADLLVEAAKTLDHAGMERVVRAMQDAHWATVRPEGM